MSPEGSRQVVDRYIKGLVDRNLDLQAEVCAPDMIQEFPQSGERIRGWANYRAAAENYPGGLPEGAQIGVVGSEDRWVLGPSFTLLRIEGTGDVYTFFGKAKYADRVTWHVMKPAFGPPTQSRPVTLHRFHQVADFRAFQKPTGGLGSELPIGLEFRDSEVGLHLPAEGSADGRSGYDLKGCSRVDRPLRGLFPVRPVLLPLRHVRSVGHKPPDIVD